VSNNVLLQGIWNCNIEAVKSAIDNGADVNCKEYTVKEHPTALQLALKCGREEIARYLISKGANVNARDKKGDTCLFILDQFQNKAEMVKLLIENGADVTVINGFGQTLLEICDPEVAVIIKNAGAK
jgi:uncharacterized protein